MINQIVVMLDEPLVPNFLLNKTNHTEEPITV